MQGDDLQGGVLDLLGVAGHDVARHDHPEVPVGCVERRGQHAGVGVGAGEHEVLHVELTQQELQVGGVEGRQALLGAHVQVPLFLLHQDVQPLGALPGVLVHRRVGGQVQLVESSPVRHAVRLPRVQVVDPAVALPVLDVNDGDADGAAGGVEHVVRRDAPAGARRRAGQFLVRPDVPAVHVDARHGRAVRVQPHVEHLG